MTELRTGKTSVTRPYKASWLNRLTDWVEKLQFWKWFFYAAIGLVLILIQMLFLWLDDGLQFTDLYPAIIFNAVIIPYLAALMHLLDNQAVTALNSMKHLLTITKPDFDILVYKLSTMPLRIPLTVGLLMVVLLITTESMGLEPDRYVALDNLPVFTILYQIIDKVSAFLVGIFIYHTVRQLQLVNTVFSNHTSINLYELKPLYAFSNLTASTAVGLVACVYSWMLLNPELMTNPVGLGGSVFFTILAVIVFVLPLVGAHRLLETEKETMLHELDLKFEALFTKFNHLFTENNHLEIAQLNGTIASLEIQYNKISAISTWPWRSGTIRSVFTALTIPLVLMIIQRLVEQALGW